MCSGLEVTGVGQIAAVNSPRPREIDFRGARPKRFRLATFDIAADAAHISIVALRTFRPIKAGDRIVVDMDNYSLEGVAIDDVDDLDDLIVLRLYDGELMLAYGELANAIYVNGACRVDRRPARETPTQVPEPNQPVVISSVPPIPARNPHKKGTFEWRQQHLELVCWLARYENIMPETGSVAWEEVIDRRSDRIVEMLEKIEAEKAGAALSSRSTPVRSRGPHCEITLSCQSAASQLPSP